MQVFIWTCPWYKNYPRTLCRNLWSWGFPGGTKESTCRCRRRRRHKRRGSIRGSGRSPGVGNDNPLQHSCLDNSMDREPGGLQSMGSQRVRHNWSDSAHKHIVLYLFQELSWVLVSGSVTKVGCLNCKTWLVKRDITKPLCSAFMLTSEDDWKGGYLFLLVILCSPTPNCFHRV